MTYLLAKDAKFASLPQGWDDGWRAAKAASGVTPAVVWFLGDSHVNGHLASQMDGTSWRWLLRNRILALGLSQGADFFPVSHGFGTTAGWGHSDYTGQAGALPWSVARQPYGYDNGNFFTGAIGSLNLALQGIGGDCTWPGTTIGTALATFTAPTSLGTITDLDIVYPDITNPMTFRYNINGGTAVDINDTGATGALQRVQITGLTAATGHQVNILSGHATNQVWVSGVTAYKSRTTGIQFAHLGMDSAILSNYNSLYLNRTLRNASATGSPGTINTGIGFPMAPDLVICDFIMSETGWFSPDVSANRMGWFIELLRWAKPNCSILFFTPYRPNGLTNDSAATDLAALNYANAVELQAEVANRYDVAYFNGHARWKSRALASGFITAGEIHPTDAGHADIDAFIGPVL